MIKIERRSMEKTRRAVVDLKKAKQVGSTYNTESVNLALREVFYGKCYICENKDVTSCQIEHLISHHENKELKYDWENLFWACAHCNNTKADRYEPILDCTKESVEKLIAFRKKGYFGEDEKLEFTALQKNEAVKNTIALLEAVY